jgi:hypothetical protein
VPPIRAVIRVGLACRMRPDSGVIPDPAVWRFLHGEGWVRALPKYRFRVEGFLAVLTSPLEDASCTETAAKKFTHKYSRLELKIGLSPQVCWSSRVCTRSYTALAKHMKTLRKEVA